MAKSTPITTTYIGTTRVSLGDTVEFAYTNQVKDEGKLSIRKGIVLELSGEWFKIDTDRGPRTMRYEGIDKPTLVVW